MCVVILLVSMFRKVLNYNEVASSLGGTILWWCLKPCGSGYAILISEHVGALWCTMPCHRRFSSEKGPFEKKKALRKALTRH